MILVQEIMTIWGKWACNASWALERHGVPEIHALPADLPPHKPGDLVHQYFEYGRMYGVYGRADCFTFPIQKTAVVHADKTFKMGSVSLAMEGPRCIIYFQDIGDLSMPEHDAPAAVKVSTLQPGQWAQVVYTGLRTDGWDYNQVFRKRVLNIGNFETWPDDLFTRQRSKMCFHSLAATHDPVWAI